jgi:hypothetical protein
MESIEQSQQLSIYEHILNLTIDLVNLATTRDLFMCLLTANSRRFLIKIVELFSEHVQVGIFSLFASGKMTAFQ